MKRWVIPFTPIQWVRIVIIVFGFCFAGCKADEPIRLGFMAGITGRSADIGMAARDAVQLAVEQCNAQGGIHGRQVTLIIRDDRQNVETAVKAVQALIDARVAAIVGPMSSAVAVAIVPYLNASQVVAVGGTVTTQDLSVLDDHFMRVTVTTREQASFSARYQIRSGDMRHVAVVYDGGNRSFSENWMENFKSPFTGGGGKILTAVEFKAGDRHSFSQISHGLLAVDPDGILIIANPMDSALLCQQIRKLNSSVKITLTNWAATQRLIELGGKSVEGVTIPIVFDWDSPDPAYQRFKKRYVDRYNRDPGFPGFYAYNAAQVVLTALKAQKPGQSLKDTILSIGEFGGLQGKISLDSYGDVKSSAASIRIIQNQKFIALE
ncbi:ABC transporter substrate-binding protein [Desulfosarcina ovata subsp. sediminis]|uniref:ABC transporter substrate-binding protein n=1 Tax=Desulfosarcina ovata subsp. sediminis TaxID=885957 RepID=A0A5K7ZRV4_9BACT|nr:ABC transporter substrate-binding protein [Desulfosarcina ovata]BBO82933.1 ABC transporter substrate-binding protein [Desulfosarcina ovata subsp. sediminis]